MLTIYIGNIPYDYDEDDIHKLLKSYNPGKVSLPIDRETRRNKGFTFVEFEDRRDAEDAYDKLNGFVLDGRRLRVDWDEGLGSKRRGRDRSRERPRRDRRSRDREDSSRGRRSRSRRRSPARRASRERRDRSRSRDGHSRHRKRSASPRRSASPNRSPSLSPK